MDDSPLVEFAGAKYDIGSGYAAVVDRLEFAPDARQLATSTVEGWIMVWGVASGELVGVMPVDDEPRKELAFSRSGTELVLCSAEFTGEYDSGGFGDLVVFVGERAPRARPAADVPRGLRRRAPPVRALGRIRRPVRRERVPSDYFPRK